MTTSVTVTASTTAQAKAAAATIGPPSPLRARVMSGAIENAVVIART
jgi:hypothetical protein